MTSLKKFKNVLALSALFGLSSASADTIDLVSFIPFAKGAPALLVKTFEESSRQVGYSVSGKIVGTCSESLARWEQSKGPAAILMTDATQLTGKKDNVNCMPNLNDTNQVPVLQAGTAYYFCSKPGYVVPTGKEITLGWISMYPIDAIYSELNNNSINRKFKYVGFKNSGAVLAGVVNGDVDMGYVSVGVATPAITAGSVECQYSNKNDGTTKTVKDLIGRDSSVLEILGKPRWLIMTKNIPESDLNKIRNELFQREGKLNKFSDVKTKLNISDKKDYWNRNQIKSDLSN